MPGHADCSAGNWHGDRSVLVARHVILVPIGETARAGHGVGSFGMCNASLGSRAPAEVADHVSGEVVAVFESGQAYGDGQHPLGQDLAHQLRRGFVLAGLDPHTVFAERAKAFRGVSVFMQQPVHALGQAEGLALQAVAYIAQRLPVGLAHEGLEGDGFAGRAHQGGLYLAHVSGNLLAGVARLVDPFEARRVEVLAGLRPIAHGRRGERALLGEADLVGRGHAVDVHAQERRGGVFTDELQAGIAVGQEEFAQVRLRTDQPLELLAHRFVRADDVAVDIRAQVAEDVPEAHGELVGQVLAGPLAHAEGGQDLVGEAGFEQAAQLVCLARPVGNVAQRPAMPHIGRSQRGHAEESSVVVAVFVEAAPAGAEVGVLAAALSRLSAVVQAFNLGLPVGALAHRQTERHGRADQDAGAD